MFADQGKWVTDLKKANIEDEKANIGSKKVNIQQSLEGSVHKMTDHNGRNELVTTTGEHGLIELTDQLLLDAKNRIHSDHARSIPIAELLTLGAGVASLIPALNTVTQTTTVAAEGLYTLTNAGVGDVLKAAKNGNFWGALKTADGTSKMAQLQAAGPLSSTATVTAISPATMMMAAALLSIEKELQDIAKTTKQILSFLEIEKEAEIEADVKTLTGLVTNYKLNWDNALFVSSNHKMVLDIQRNARKNMIAYQKKINDTLREKQLFVAQSKINATLADLEKKFQYYRLSLYTFSLASLMEVMLSGNFKEEYIAGIRDEITALSETYRNLFSKCSVRLEKLGADAVEVHVAKGIGTANQAVGKFIGKIPVVKEGPVDEFLQGRGAHLRKNASKMEQKAVKTFAPLHDPKVGVFAEKMDDMIHIYNRTSQICFDHEKIYLLEDH